MYRAVCGLEGSQKTVKNIRLTAALVFGLTACMASAQEGVIELTSFPTISVSDGRTPVTISAIVRDRSGNMVPNGTQVIFESTLGSFRESIVTTEHGLARATLLAPSVPGIAQVRASVLRFSARQSLELEFVADKSLLDSAKEYVEVNSARTLLYSINHKIIESSAEGRGVSVRYRDIHVEADDIQLHVPSYRLKARNAKVTWAGKVMEVQELVMKLNVRRGLGMATYETDTVRVVQSGPLIVPVPVKRQRLGPVELTSQGLKPFENRLERSELAFEDITSTLSSVEAKKAVAFPLRDIYFYRSNVKVSGSSVMKVPLFQLNSNAVQPIVTDQFVNVTSNQLSVNYPYFLTLKPGETSLVRLRYGSRFGSGVGASQGLMLDYEYKWNQGDKMDGGITLYGMNRSDWGASIRHFIQPNSRTSIAAQVDFPAHRSISSNFSVNQSFEGYSANLSMNLGQTLGRTEYSYRSQQVNFLLEKDPTPLGRLPFQLFFGVNATASRYTAGGYDRSQTGAGFQSRIASRPIRVDDYNTISTSYRISQLFGSGARQGIAHYGTLGISSNLGSNLGLFTTYTYTDDGFNSIALGRHQIGTEAYWSSNNLSLRGFMNKSLDINRLGAGANARWTVSDLWRVYYNYTLDRYFDGSFMDQNVILGYRLGVREIGLSYSQRTKRLGIEVLGVSF